MLTQLNKILNVHYYDVEQFSIKQLRKACLILQVQQSLAENPSFGIAEDAPRGVRPFGELQDGSVFYFADEPHDWFVKHGDGGLDTKTDKAQYVCYVCVNTRVVFVGPPQEPPQDDLLFHELLPGECFTIPGESQLTHTHLLVYSGPVDCQSGNCPPSDSWINAERAGSVASVRVHVCPDTPVARVPSQEKPQDKETLFYELNPGECFVVPDNTALGSLEKLPRWEQEATTCQCDNCPDDEAWLNAKNSFALAHICPDRKVTRVPF